MKKLIKFNLKLLLNKITIILLICTIMLVNLVYIIEIINLDDNESYTMNCMMFFTSSLFYVRLIIAFVSIYLFSYVITPKGDYSLYTLRMFNYGRDKCFFSKLISVCIIILLFVFCSCIFFIIWGLIEFKALIYIKDYCIAYINVYLVSINYGLIGLILMQIVNSYFIMIVTCVVNLFVSGIEEIDEISKIVCFILPKITENGESVFGIAHLVWLIIIYMSVGYLIYYRRDLNY